MTTDIELYETSIPLILVETIWCQVNHQPDTCAHDHCWEVHRFYESLETVDPPPHHNTIETARVCHCGTPKTSTCRDSPYSDAFVTRNCCIWCTSDPASCYE